MGRRRSRIRAALRHALLGFTALVLVTLLAGCGGSSLDAGYAVPANASVEGRHTQTRTTTGDPVPGTPGQPVAPVPATAGGTLTETPSGSGIGATPDADGGANAGGGHTSASGGHRGDCDGFRNGTGISDSAVTIATIADVSGPVPGIFTSAHQAVKAYAAYFNATSNLCGRRLEVLPLDSRTDAVAEQSGYLKACDQAFAAVGSMSAFDSGGAATAQECGLPDLRAMAVSDPRNACRTCFGAQATDLHAFQNAIPDFFVKNYPEASKHAAMVYVNAAASVLNAKTQQAVEERRGMKFVYTAGFDVAEFNYGPYVQQLKQHGVRWVQFVGSADQAVKLARAMQQASYEPDVFLLDPTAYDPQFTQAGDAVEGAFVFVDFTPFEEAARSSELRLYLQWLHQVAPSAAPSYFGLFAWSAARLFVEQAAELGGDLSRARLVAGLRRVHAWTGNGLHAPQDVGGKVNSSCWRFLRLRDGHWVPAGGMSYLCRGSTKIG
ncbi:MAG: ABC transporter substrate-binding protein [Nocardioidaceae bacterium]|nr:ABC transporter substrate-binding protein [Nocardioidaceae bacterium]